VFVRKHRKVWRLNLELGPRSYEALNRLQCALETSSQAETIRIALQTLARLVDEEEQGARVFIERHGQQKVEVLLPLSARATESNDQPSRVIPRSVLLKR
jgi:hypothetical protein